MLDFIEEQLFKKALPSVSYLRLDGGVPVNQVLTMSRQDMYTYVAGTWHIPPFKNKDKILLQTLLSPLSPFSFTILIPSYLALSAPLRLPPFPSRSGSVSCLNSTAILRSTFCC